MLAPPYVIEESEIDEIVDRFGEAMEMTVGRMGAERA
jgi:adenosylmethionine-8-amino-7-oxononanoate aminotransferase